MKYTVLTFLDTHNIPHTLHEHEAVFTVEESKSIKDHLHCTHTKNLFLTDKKDFYLVSIQADKRADIQQIREILGTKKLSFASPDKLMDQLGLTPGSVGIFGLLLALEKKKALPRVLIDKTLWNAEYVGRHPNDNTATVILPQASVRTMLNIRDIQALAALL